MNYRRIEGQSEEKREHSESCGARRESRIKDGEEKKTRFNLRKMRKQREI